jgi:hypothetical protein
MKISSFVESLKRELIHLFMRLMRIQDAFPWRRGPNPRRNYPALDKQCSHSVQNGHRHNAALSLGA